MCYVYKTAWNLLNIGTYKMRGIIQSPAGLENRRRGQAEAAEPEVRGKLKHIIQQ